MKLPPYALPLGVGIGLGALVAYYYLYDAKTGPVGPGTGPGPMPVPTGNPQPPLQPPQVSPISAEGARLLAEARDPNSRMLVPERYELLARTAQAQGNPGLASELQNAATRIRTERDPVPCLRAPCPYGPVVRPGFGTQPSAVCDPTIASPNMSRMPPMTQALYEKLMADPVPDRQAIQRLVGQLDACGAFPTQARALERRLT